jgi:hypothetical protein
MTHQQAETVIQMLFGLLVLGGLILGCVAYLVWADLSQVRSAAIEAETRREETRRRFAPPGPSS